MPQVHLLSVMLTCWPAHNMVFKIRTFDLFWFILLEERREPYTRLGVKQCMLRLNACVCVCVFVCVCVCMCVEVPGMGRELKFKAEWEKLGRTIRMVWTRTGVWQNVLLCSSLELRKIFYDLQMLHVIFALASSALTPQVQIRLYGPFFHNFLCVSTRLPSSFLSHRKRIADVAV